MGINLIINRTNKWNNEYLGELWDIPLEKLTVGQIIRIIEDPSDENTLKAICEELNIKIPKCGEEKYD